MSLVLQKFVQIRNKYNVVISVGVWQTVDPDSTKLKISALLTLIKANSGRELTKVTDGDIKGHGDAWTHSSTKS